MTGTPSDRGKCGTCAFLCLRGSEWNSAAIKMLEMPTVNRQSGNLVQVQIGHSQIIGGTPGCSKRREDVWKWIDERSTEIKNALPAPPRYQADVDKIRDQAAREFMDHPRGCKAWRPYMEGLSPAESASLEATERMYERFADFEQRQQDRHRRYMRRMNRIERRGRTVANRIAWFVGIAALVATLLPMFFPRGWMDLSPKQISQGSPPAGPLPAIPTPAPTEAPFEKSVRDFIEYAKKQAPKT